MHTVTKRTAAFSAAIVGIALIGSGCQATKEKTGEALSSASSVVSSASSAIAEPSTTAESAAPSTTQMAGADGKEYTVSGPILEKYDSLTPAQKTDLGKPKGDEQKTADGGVYQEFDGGVIIHKTESYVVWGKIRDKWNEVGGSQGELGYPTSDETDSADGSKQQTFQHGTITWKPGEEEATVTKH
ncbi:MAG: LGFP repeat-containing protein [Mycobacterium sp.]